MPIFDEEIVALNLALTESEMTGLQGNMINYEALNIRTEILLRSSLLSYKTRTIHFNDQLPLNEILFGHTSHSSFTNFTNLLNANNNTANMRNCEYSDILICVNP